MSTILFFKLWGTLTLVGVLNLFGYAVIHEVNERFYFAIYPKAEEWLARGLIAEGILWIGSLLYAIWF